MANINKIRLSGQTYDIQDLNALKSVELTQAQYNALVSGGTVDPNTFYIITDAEAGDLTNYYTKSETNTLLGGKQDTLVSGTNIKTINNESILGSGNINIQGGGTIDPSLDSGSTNAVANSAITAAINAVSGAVDTKQDILSAGTGIDITDNVISATGGGGGIDSGTVQSMIDESISGKQDTLSAGTGIDITDNVISATGGGGGGGKAISAGTNISVTTGETADTINCTLPITVNSPNSVYSFGSNTLTDIYSAFVYGVSNNISRLSSSDFSFYNIIGRNNNAKGSELNIIGYNNSVSHSNVSRGAIRSVFVGNSNVSSDTGQYNFSNRIIIGFNNTISGGSYNAVIGNNLICGSYSETALGRYNNSVTEDISQTNYSGNTIFSIGNGTSNSARHNAFEIRQNGDIYYFDGSNDVKLQDKISTIETTIGNINTVLESI